jgi:hypothetical protein
VNLALESAWRENWSDWKLRISIQRAATRTENSSQILEVHPINAISQHLGAL